MAEPEKRRLFVGGLHSETTADHLRACFKSFGSVSSVEIIQRKGESGYAIKTFAYVDVDMTDRSLKKCVSILNNSKWKGNHLKIQVAKESFLMRLHGERSEQCTEHHNSDALPREKKAGKELKEKLVKNGKAVAATESSVPAHVGSASPGTLVEGKRNWVVGKFGRVLPIVFLRRKDGRKISKFDPSQTTHCLKKIKEGGEPMPVSKLTWSLEEREQTNLNSTVAISRRTSQEQQHYSRSVNKAQKRHNSFDGTPHEESDTVSDCMSSSDHSLGERDSEAEELSFQCVEQGPRAASTKLNSQENSEKHSCLHVPLNVNGQFTDSTKTKIMKKGNRMRLVEEEGEEAKDGGDDDNDDDEGDDDDDEEEEEDDYDDEGENGDDEEENDDDEEDDVDEGESDDNDDSMEEDVVEIEIDERMRGKKDEEDKEIQESHTYLHNQNKETKGFDSNCKSSYSYLGMKEINTVRESQNKITTAEEVNNNTDAPNVLKGNNQTHNFASVSEGHCLQTPEVNPKPGLSDIKRLDALRKRQEICKTQKNLIKDALQKVDCKQTEHGSGNHIVFEDEDNERKETQQKSHAADSSNKKISGSKATSWLGLDSEGDSSGEEEVKNRELFSVKEQFEGKAGEKLFRLQTSFGGDERFKLDENFLESDETADAEQSEQIDTADVPNEPESEIHMDMHKEKEMYLSVLQKVLKGNVTTSHHHQSNTGKDMFTKFSTVRYDPTKDGHEEFEQKEAQNSAPPKPGGETRLEEDQMLPKVSGEKFYDVNTSLLTSLFGKQNQDQVLSPFTFFDQESPTKVGEAKDLKFKQWNPQHLPYDSSGSEDDDEFAEEENDVNGDEANTARPREPEQLFFFHVDNPELKNRLFVEESPFMRTQSVEQLNEHWVSVRSELTQDYKRKHKDAIRRQRRMAAKRAKL